MLSEVNEMNNIIRVFAGVLLMAAMLFVSARLPRNITDAAVPAANSAETVNNVKNSLYIRKNTVVSESETLYVRDGGRLYIMDGAKLTVKGKLKCAAGGEIYVRGTVDMKRDSSASISGKMKILSMGRLELNGKLGINSAGVIKGMGCINVRDFSDIKCVGTVTVKINAPKPVVKDGLTTVGGILVANKEISLPEDYGNGLDRNTYNAFVRMKRDSGFDMTIVSGFRSYERQVEVFDYWCMVDGREKAEIMSAVPGHSEHQTGFVIDVSSLEQSYGDTDEGKWLAANCYKYGFIIRYPEGKEDITGYAYEPWHRRYLGASTAKLVYDSGLTLEEFLGLA